MTKIAYSAPEVAKLLGISKSAAYNLICTPFTGHPVEGVLLCGTHMSIKGNV